MSEQTVVEEAQAEAERRWPVEWGHPAWQSRREAFIAGYVAAEAAVVRRERERAVAHVTKRMIEQQTANTHLDAVDWAAPFRERGELCGSAYVCTAWVLRYLDEVWRGT